MLEKFKAMPKKAKIMLTTARMMCMTSAVALADEAGSATDFGVTQLQTIISSITGTINVTSIIGILAAAITVAAGFAFMWWGVRKGARMVMGAIRKGRIGV